MILAVALFALHRGNFMGNVSINMGQHAESIVICGTAGEGSHLIAPKFTSQTDTCFHHRRVNIQLGLMQLI